MLKKTARALDRAPSPKQRLNLSNQAGKLRRIRNEVALILEAIDDGLAQIEASNKLSTE